MDKLYQDHFEQFGVDPVVIGLLFSSSSDLFNAIMESIENDKPYNEYNQLSNSDKELYNKGQLVF